MLKPKKCVTRSKRYFWKSQFWAQNLTFWPLEGLGKSFPADNIYIVWNALLLSNFMQKIENFWRSVRKQSLKKSNFGPSLTFWPHPQGVKSFFENRKTSLFYIYAVLTLCKISKTSGARILRYQRYGRTDGWSWIYRTLSAKAVGPKKIHVKKDCFGQSSKILWGITKKSIKKNLSKKLIIYSKKNTGTVYQTSIIQGLIPST